MISFVQIHQVSANENKMMNNIRATCYGPGASMKL